MPVSLHGQHQGPGTGKPKLNTSIANVIHSTCCFPAMTCETSVKKPVLMMDISGLDQAI